MHSAFLEKLFAVMAALALVGVAIDFLLPEEQHEALMKRLVRLRREFEDARRKGFVVGEVSFFVAVFDWIFGPQLWSLQRAKATGVCILLAVGVALLVLGSRVLSIGYWISLLSIAENSLPVGNLITSIMLLVAFSVPIFVGALSVTRFFAVETIRLMGPHRSVNAALLAAVLALHGATLLVWLPTVQVLQAMAASAIGLVIGWIDDPELFTREAVLSSIHQLFRWTPDLLMFAIEKETSDLHRFGILGWFALPFRYDQFEAAQWMMMDTAPYQYPREFRETISLLMPLFFVVSLPATVLSIAPMILRLLLTVGYLGAVVFEVPMSLFFAAIVTKKKPVFTLMFGIPAALAKVAQELVK